MKSCESFLRKFQFSTLADLGLKKCLFLSTVRVPSLSTHCPRKGVKNKILSTQLLNAPFRFCSALTSFCHNYGNNSLFRAKSLKTKQNIDLMKPIINSSNYRVMYARKKRGKLTIIRAKKFHNQIENEGDLDLV